MTTCRTGIDFGRPHLVVPYTLDVNDMRFATSQGFNSGEQFYQYLKDSFDVLYAEGKTTPRMMSVGCIAAWPAGQGGLLRWNDFSATPGILKTCGFAGASTSPGTGMSNTHHGQMQCRRAQTVDKASFMARLRRYFRTFTVDRRAGLGIRACTVASVQELHAAFSEVIRSADRERQLALLRAHPQLACAIASGEELTAESRGEQRGAGLDQCSAWRNSKSSSISIVLIRTSLDFLSSSPSKDSAAAQILESFRSPAGKYP